MGMKPHLQRYKHHTFIEFHADRSGYQGTAGISIVSDSVLPAKIGILCWLRAEPSRLQRRPQQRQSHQQHHQRPGNLNTIGDP